MAHTRPDMCVGKELVVVLSSGDNLGKAQEKLYHDFHRWSLLQEKRGV